MSKKRLVEYVVVAGVKKNQAPSTAARTETSGAEYLSSPLSPLSPLSEHVSRGKGFKMELAAAFSPSSQNLGHIVHCAALPVAM